MTKIESLVGTSPERIAEVLCPLFREWKSRDVRWAVVRGWEGLPNWTRHDVDILIHPDDLEKAVASLRECVSKTLWHIYGNFRFSDLHSYWLMSEGRDVHFLQLDLMTGSSIRGVPFFDAAKWMERRWVNDADIYCMPIAYAAGTIIVKELVANGEIKGELRWQQVDNALKEDSEELMILMTEVGLDCNSFKDLASCLRNRNSEQIKSFSSKLRDCMRRRVLRHPLSAMRYIYDYFRLKTFPFLRLFIAFVGPDGCGKTTIGDEIQKKFHQRPFMSQMRIHSHFGNMPRLRELKRLFGWLRGKKVVFESEPEPGTRGMGMTKPHSAIKSIFYILYYGLGLALARFKLWNWRTYSSLIIADRYFYDYYYMRGYMKAPKWVKNLAYLIIPKPHMVFVLERPAEDIFAQKPELEIYEIKRQQEEIRKCLSNDKRAVFVDASHGIADAVMQVRKAIEEWLIKNS